MPWIYLPLPLYNHKGFDLAYTWMAHGFPYFLQFKSEFGNKEFMIWAGLIFCWLYRASPSLAAKNRINLILELTIWWCPYVSLMSLSSLVLLEEGVCCDQCVLLEKLLTFSLLHFVLQGQICLLLQVSLDFLLFYSSPLWWKGHLFGGVSSRRSYRGS